MAKKLLGKELKGRPSDDVKHKFLRILEESHAYERLKRILAQTKSDDTFMKALQIALERGIGKPIQEVKPVDDSGNYKPFVIMLSPQTEGTAGSVG